LRAYLIAAALLASGLASAAQWGKAEFSGLLGDTALDELSGLAHSRRRGGLLWGINDSGNPAHLVAISTEARHVATLRVSGVGNIDWEDLDSFTLDGKHYLMIADTGDNGGVRDVLNLHFIEEPAELRDGMAVVPSWTVRFRWPDGARDCEATAVDPARGEVLLVSKKRVPPELFRVPIRPANDAVQTAEPIGLLRGIAQPDAEQMRTNPVYGRYRSQISAADLSADGRTLAVMNYHAVYFYARRPGAGWADALAKPQRVLPFPWLPQAEALAFSPDGLTLYVGSEQTPVPLLKFRQAR
jgi:hypothetical protein